MQERFAGVLWHYSKRVFNLDVKMIQNRIQILPLFRDWSSGGISECIWTALAVARDDSLNDDTVTEKIRFIGIRPAVSHLNFDCRFPVGKQAKAWRNE